MMTIHSASCLELLFLQLSTRPRIESLKIAMPDENDPSNLKLELRLGTADASTAGISEIV